jgi:multidrug efflux pump subunit AcrB
MGLAEQSIRNRVVTLTLTVVMIGAGVRAFEGLSRLEDPEFTIKEALVVTPYPGASAEEVEQEVTDRIERAVQQLGQLKRVKESRSMRGLSIVRAQIQDKYDRASLPQVWDELRRKVNDVQGQLPPGAGPSIVNDDFGDVWGVFVAISGPEYSYAELKEFAKFLQREFTLVPDVAKVALFAARPEVVYVEPDRDRLSQLEIPPERIERELRSKNLVADAGSVKVGPDFLAIEPTGVVSRVEDFGSILISAGESERQIYLRDIAKIHRGYRDPPEALIRYDGAEAIGIGISTASGGNVVRMGEALAKRMGELRAFLPLGIDLGLISVQSQAVTVAIDGFLVSLIEAVVIVIVVLLVFMGLRSALLIGFILFLTIMGTFIFMAPWGVALERISLGALIIALGMLVDNAIVVVDGMLVKMQAGQDPERAASDVVSQQSMPLLGATAVAVLAFAAIGTSQDSTGEFCRSLFQVVMISLLLSWVTAVTVTPLLGVMFLERGQAGAADPYGGALYARYRAFLAFCLRRRGLAVGVVVALFGASLYGFQFVDRSFFPNSTRPQFMVDFWMPRGTHIEDTLEQAKQAEGYLRGLPDVTHVTTVVGQGAMRFLLTYTGEQPDSGYAQLLVDVDDYTKIAGMIPDVEASLAARHPDAIVVGKEFRLGPGEGGRIQVRVTGTERDELRVLADQIKTIMKESGNAKGVRLDWRQRVLSVIPVVAEEQANLNGLTRQAVASAVAAGFEGEPVGVFRERDELLPIVVRAPEPQRSNVANIQNLQIWSPAASAYIPLRQVVSRFDSRFEDTLIMRRDRRRTITVNCDQIDGTADALLERLMPEIAKIELPPGYFIEYGGEYESSRDAQQGLSRTLPVFFLAMVLIVIALFNALRQPLVIWLTVPLALIGVTGGLLITRQPFGFMALLGFLSLSGMLIKNAIVLIDQIDLEIREGKEPAQAVMDSAVSRLRPVAMAAATTVLGMIPLLQDAFFVAMAVTIMAGLTFATLLTMIVVPVLYSAFFRIPAPEARQA